MQNTNIRLKIIVPVNTTEFDEAILQAVQKVRAPDVEIDIEHITEGTPFIESRIDLAINAPHVIALAQKAEQDGYDGLFVTDMDMCGVDAARQAVKIPIIGGFRASAYTCMMLGQKLSILTVKGVVDLQDSHMREFGIADNLASIRPLNKTVNELKNPTPEEKEQILQELYELGLKAVREDGASCLMFGCTGFSDFAATLADRISTELKTNIPVMDPNCCAISYLTLLVRNKLAQSGASYPYIPE